MKNVSSQTKMIQSRFFQALEIAIQNGKIPGLQTFCKNHGLMRTKYQLLRTCNTDEPLYKSIDIDALQFICEDFHVSPEWLLLGKGKMFVR